MELQKIKKPLLLLISLLIGFIGIAAEPVKSAKVEDAVMKLAKEYENKKGVECETFVKGEGLELIKLMLRKEFGKEFMKGVTSIVIIEYGEASEDVCKSIRKSLDLFTSVLEEIDLNKLDDKEVKESSYARCFCNVNEESDTLSDFIIAIEDGKDKMIMYMGGKIIME